MGDMSMPADYPTIPQSVYEDAKLVKLAREIAMGIGEMPDILARHNLTQVQFDAIKQLPHFGRMLAAELEAWSSASNTKERVAIKAGSMIEEYLPELYARLNDASEPLMAKIKAIELISKMAGFGDRDIPAAGSPGDRVQVIINLGADTKLQYDKRLPSKVIDVTPEAAFTESTYASANQV